MNAHNSREHEEHHDLHEYSDLKLRNPFIRTCASLCLSMVPMCSPDSVDIHGAIVHDLLLRGLAVPQLLGRSVPGSWRGSCPRAPGSRATPRETKRMDVPVLRKLGRSRRTLELSPRCLWPLVGSSRIRTSDFTSSHLAKRDFLLVSSAQRADGVVSANQA